MAINRSKHEIYRRKATTGNRHFQNALGQLRDIRRTLDTGDAINWLSMFFEQLEKDIAQGWLECRGIDERGGPEGFWIIVKFREEAPRWLDAYYGEVKAKWSVTDEHLMSGDHPEIYGEPLSIDQFLVVVEGYFENGVTLFEHAERSALDPTYEPDQPLVVVDHRQA